MSQDFEIWNGILGKYQGSGGAVVIPDGVTNIGYCAFSECESLTAVTIPNSVTSIGWRAFYKCENLTTVNIPDSVTSIKEDAFRHCKNLKYAPLMIVEGKLIYEPENRKGVSWWELKQLIFEKDYFMKINLDVKYNMIFQMFTAGIDEEGVSAYIKKNFVRMFKFLINHDDVDTIQKVIDSGKFLNKRNIDKLIEYAIDNQHIEIQVLLMDYKAREIGYSDPLKKFNL